MAFASIVRTVVPFLVGAIIMVAARYGIDLPETAVTEVVTPIATAVVGGVYYAAGRFLETRVPANVRAAGRFLLSFGLSRQEPVYVPASEVDAARAQQR